MLSHQPPLDESLDALINGISASSSRSESRESTEGIRLRLWSSSKEPHHVDFNNTRHPARPDDLVAWRSAQIRSVSQNPLLFFIRFYLPTDLAPSLYRAFFLSDSSFHYRRYYELACILQCQHKIASKKVVIQRRSFMTRQSA